MLGPSCSFKTCFGLPEQLSPGPENIKSGLNGAARPPYGLILFENVAMGPTMPLELSNAQKPLKNAKNPTIRDFRLRPPPMGMPRVGPYWALRGLYVHCASAEGSLRLFERGR